MAQSEASIMDEEKLGNRQRSIPSSEYQTGQGFWSESPHHLASTFRRPQRALSPAKVSPTTCKSLPSPTRSRGSILFSTASNFPGNRSGGGATVVGFGAESRKGKRALMQVETADFQRILQNRLLQWCFVNARAEFAANTQRLLVEVSKLEDWSCLQREHSSALSETMEALEAATLRVPVKEGVRADTQSVKEAMASAINVVHVVESSLVHLLPKVEEMNGLVSDLAQVAAQEKTLLEECGDLLTIASALEVEERCLRTHLIQFEQERVRVLGHLMPTVLIYGIQKDYASFEDIGGLQIVLDATVISSNQTPEVNDIQTPEVNDIH